MSTEFIKLISDLHEERFNAHLASLAQNQTPCGIFFAFKLTPNIAAENIRQLQKIPLNVTCAIVVAEMQVDALKNLVDVPVITLDDLENFPAKPREVFITDEFEYGNFAFVPYFERQGIDTLTFSDGNYFALMMKHLPELYRVHEMLGSDESKKSFRAAIKGRLTGKLNDYRFATEPQYFLEGFTPCAGDIAIDGGAYDGATATAFANCGAKVFAFEMDATNYQKCLSNLDGRGNITLENLGLSDRAGVEHYTTQGTASNKNSDGALTANFIDLDSYVARMNLPHVDYIKLDIEGAELDMLHGAARTIERFKPKMAVSAYHKPEDLWTLALYIKSLRPDYEFEFRHYQIDATNYILNDGERAVLRYFGLKPLLPTIYEFVLYCR